MGASLNLDNNPTLAWAAVVQRVGTAKGITEESGLERDELMTVLFGHLAEAGTTPLQITAASLKAALLASAPPGDEPPPDADADLFVTLLMSVTPEGVTTLDVDGFKGIFGPMMEE